MRVWRLWLPLVFLFGCGGGQGLFLHPPDVGETFPDLPLAAPDTAADARYLGVRPTADTVRLSSLPADLIVLDLFDTDCLFCRRALGDLRRMRDRVEEQGLAGRVRFVGIAVGDSADDLRKYRRKYDVPMAVLPDPEQSTRRALGRFGVPTLYGLRPRGGRLEVVARHEGAPAARWDDFLEACLTGAGLPVSSGR